MFDLEVSRFHAKLFSLADPPAIVCRGPPSHRDARTFVWPWSLMSWFGQETPRIGGQLAWGLLTTYRLVGGAESESE